MDSSEVLWTRKSKSRRIEEVEYRAPPKLFNCYIGKNQWVDNKGIIYYKDTDVDNENDQDDSDSEGYENDDYPDSDDSSWLHHIGFMMNQERELNRLKVPIE